MDTGNMSKCDNVGTTTDHEILVRLKSYLPPRISATSIYEEIRNAKTHFSSMTVLEMLHKDLKVLKGNHMTVAIASVTNKMEDILSRPEFLKDSAEFCVTLPADVLIIMTIWKDSVCLSQHAIAIFSLNKTYRQQITDVLLQSSESNLYLQPIFSYGDLETVCSLIQNNLQVFQKEVISLIQSFLAGETGTLDKTHTTVQSVLQHNSDIQLKSESDKTWNTSEEDERKHINLAKTLQFDKFQTSQDKYDLDAVGIDSVISPSLSSDSDLSKTDKSMKNEDKLDQSLNDAEDEARIVHYESSELKYDSVGTRCYNGTTMNKHDTSEEDSINILIETKEGFGTSGAAFVDNLMDFGFHNHDIRNLSASESPQTNLKFLDTVSGGHNDFLFLDNTRDILFGSDLTTLSNTDFLCELNEADADSRDEAAYLCNASSENITQKSFVLDVNDWNPLAIDVHQQHGPCNLNFSNDVYNPVALSCVTTTGQALGEGTISGTTLSHNPARIKSENLFDDHNQEALFVEGRSRDDGSLTFSVVPQNSYVDFSSGFDFLSSSHQLPELINSEIMEQVNEDQSQTDLSFEQLEGSECNVLSGPNSGERCLMSEFCANSVHYIPVSAGVQITATPQNNYAEVKFVNSCATRNLSSFNNAELVDKINAKQSAMFGSQNSLESQDSGSCHSQEIIGKSPAEICLFTPQTPYALQHSQPDNLGGLNPQNNFLDLSETAQECSNENVSKYNLGKLGINSSSGDDYSEENNGMNINKQGQPCYGRNTSNQLDSQNKISDVEFLFSTDVGTTSENTVGIASHLKIEIAKLGRKDADVFMQNKTKDEANDDECFKQLRLSQINLLSSETASYDEVIETNSDEAVIGCCVGGDINGYAGTKDLLFPVDNNKNCSTEDHGIFETVEHIVAQSVAAAVQFNLRDTETITDDKLKWINNAESVCLNCNTDYDVLNCNTDYDVLNCNTDYDVNGFQKICDSGGENNDISPEIFSEFTLEKLQREQQQHHQQLSQQEHQGDGIQKILCAYENHVLQIGSSHSPEAETGVPYFSGSLNIVTLTEEERLADLVLHELAYELVTELIQKALENISNSSDLVAESGVIEDGKEKLGVDEVICEADQAKMIWKVGLDNAVAIVTREINTAAFNIPESIENVDRISVNSMEIPAILDLGNFEMANSAEPRSAVNTTRCNPGTNITADQRYSGTALESRKYSNSYIDSNSSPERKRFINENLSETVIEDMTVTNFSKRRTSVEFIIIKEVEEAVYSLPERRFSKSDSSLLHRFSRDENSRSSRLEDSDLEMAIRQEDTESYYIPNMDPFQGSLDAIDESFTKIIHIDDKVVEGENIQKANDEELLNNSYMEDTKDEGTNRVFRSWLEQSSYYGNSYKTFDADSKNTGLNERHNRNFDNIGELLAEKEEVLEILTANTSNKLDKQPADICIDLEMQAKHKVIKLNVQAADLATDSEDAIFNDSQELEDEDTEDKMNKLTPEQRKKIHLSFNQDFDEEVSDTVIKSSSRASFRSPLPPKQSEDSVSSFPHPPPLEKCHNKSSHEDVVILLSPILSPSSSPKSFYQQHMKEVYHTSVGRISIASEDEDNSHHETPHQSSSFTDQVVMKESGQVGRIIQSAEDTISEIDCQLHMFDVTSHICQKNMSDYTDVSQTSLSSFAMQSPYEVSTNPEHKSCTTFSFVTAKPNVDNFDHLNSNFNVTTSNINDEIIMNSDSDTCKHDRGAVLLTPEQLVISHHPAIFSYELPVQENSVLNESEPLASDPLTFTSTHIRNLSSTSFGSVKGAMYTEEWQDDEIVEVAAQSGLGTSPVDSVRKKIIPDLSFAQALADDNDEEIEGKDENLQDTHVDTDTDLEWENDTPVETFAHCYIELTHVQECAAQKRQRWKRVSISGSEFNIDMDAVEPFKNVLSHGGYYDEGLSAIIVFYGCKLPSRDQGDYAYVMDHLFHYVIYTLEELVAEDYVIIYFHGSTPNRQMPGLMWLRRCYHSIDKRLKKNLKGLFLVHPTLLLRTIITMIKPFISFKFSSKLKYISSLEELNSAVPMSNISIPEAIVQHDDNSSKPHSI